jgi:hypothetical protein
MDFSGNKQENSQASWYSPLTASQHSQEDLLMPSVNQQQYSQVLSRKHSSNHLGSSHYGHQGAIKSRVLTIVLQICYQISFTMLID